MNKTDQTIDIHSLYKQGDYIFIKATKILYRIDKVWAIPAHVEWTKILFNAEGIPFASELTMLPTIKLDDLLELGVNLGRGPNFAAIRALYGK